LRRDLRKVVRDLELVACDRRKVVRDLELVAA
jgi:hypothetical protein